MKIAIFATNIGVVSRGAETFVIELTKNISLECEVVVYSIGVSEYIRENIKKVDYVDGLLFSIANFLYNSSSLIRKVMDKVHYVVPSVIRQYFFCKKLYQEYGEELKEFDIIFPNNGVWGMRLANKIKKKSGAKVIYTGHGGIGLGEKIILKNNPDLYIAVTPQSLVWSRAFIDNVVCIPNGVDPDRFSKFYNDKHENKNILCVGAFVDFKRQDLLIRAMPYLPDFHLTLLGAGARRKELELLCNEVIPNRFTIKELPYESIVDEYFKASVFSLPSENEPFGIVYLEALCAGIPLVVPDDQSRRYICGKYAIFCDVTEPSVYAKSILKASDSLDMAGSLDYVIENFSWSAISKKYIDVFKEVI